MFKSTLAAVVAAASFTTLPAQAAPQTCAFRFPDRSVEEFSCDVNTRLNANGHKVNDITVFYQGRSIEMSVILWKNADGTPDYAETFYKGEQDAIPYFRAKNGMFGVGPDQGTTFYF